MNHPLPPDFDGRAVDWSAFRKKRPSLATRLLLSLILLALSVYPVVLLAFPLSETATLGISAVACLFSLLGQSLMLKKTPGLFSHTLTLLLVGILSGSIVLPALCGAFLTAVTVFVYLGICAPSPLLLLCPLAAYGISAALSTAPFLSFLSLATLPTALLLWNSVRRARSRNSVVAWMSFGILGTAAVGGCLYVLLTYHTLSAELLRSLLDSAREALTTELANRFDLVETTLGTVLSADDLLSISETLVTTFFNFLPAFVILAAMALSWWTDTALLRVLRGAGAPKAATVSMMLFDMSLPSAVVYFLCLLLSLMLDTPDTGLYSVAAQNILLILAPGMLMVAWMFFGALLLSKLPSCFGILIYMLVIYLVLQFSAYLLPLAAALGAGVTLYQQIRFLLANRKSR